MKRFAVLLLSLILAVASVTMQVARAQAAGVTEMVICSGYGVATVTLNADGNPIGPVHPCPDCLAGAGLALLPGAVPPAVAPHVSTRLARSVGHADGGIGGPIPRARGPPLA